MLAADGGTGDGGIMSPQGSLLQAPRRLKYREEYAKGIETHFILPITLRLRTSTEKKPIGRGSSQIGIRNSVW